MRMTGLQLYMGKRGGVDGGVGALPG